MQCIAQPTRMFDKFYAKFSMCSKFSPAAASLCRRSFCREKYLRNAFWITCVFIFSNRAQREKSQLVKMIVIGFNKNRNSFHTRAWFNFNTNTNYSSKQKLNKIILTRAWWSNFLSLTSSSRNSWRHRIVILDFDRKSTIWHKFDKPNIETEECGLIEADAQMGWMSGQLAKLC